MKALTITPAIRAAIDAVRLAEESFAPGRDSYAEIELPLLALARATRAAWTVQAQRTADQRARMALLPKPRPAVVVELALRAKRIRQ